MSDIDFASGRAVREHRNRAGMNQQELGEKVGVQQATVAKWERGAVPMRLRDAVAICRILGITLGELWDEPQSDIDRYQQGVKRGIELSRKALERLEA